MRVGHDGSLGCKRVKGGRCVAGACWVRSGTGTRFCFVLNSIFALKRSQLTESGLCCFWIQEGSKMADGSAECLLLKLVLSGPSELGAELSNCQDILPFLAS